MKKYDAPGVYINELDPFPVPVVQVPTGVPVFIGYTETAVEEGKNVTGVPVRISSLAQFEAHFGGEPVFRFDFSLRDGEALLELDEASRFNMHSALKLFFDNGGSTCWIMSVGCYGKEASAFIKSADHFGEAVWQELAKLEEPSIVVMPDAVFLPSAADYKAVWDRGLAHCAEMQNRVAIVDVFKGDRQRTYDEVDVISGQTGLRNLLSAQDMSFAAAYYPWVNTSLHDAATITFDNVSAGTRQAFFDHVGQEPSIQADESRKTIVGKLLKSLMDEDKSDAEKASDHKILLGCSRRYNALVAQAVTAVSVMPPSSALAGAYAMTDNQVGVWKAPANISLAAVLSPCVAISDAEQDDLNAPLDGKAVNAIRSFAGRGTLVWGARTLDGNSAEWRYVNIRRTSIMVEQSIRAGLEPFVFSPNTATTWLTVKSSIEMFLNSLWKDGALMGATPADAYSVDVGLGTTMTSADVEAGYMIVVVKAALTRPAEFVVLSLRQLVQQN